MIKVKLFSNRETSFARLISKAASTNFIISDGASGLRFESAYYCACALNMSLSIYVNAQTSCLLIQDNTAQLLVGCAKLLTICCRQQTEGYVICLARRETVNTLHSIIAIGWA